MGARNIKRLWTEAFVQADPLPLASGDAVTILPQTDDTGSLQFGNGTKDLDVTFFAGSATEYLKVDVGDSEVQLAGVPLAPSGAGRVQFKIPTTLTANAVTLNSTHFGGLVQVEAGEASVLTLPDAAAANAGDWVMIAQREAQDLTVKPATADKLILLNNLTADSIIANTGSQQIGATIQLVSDGTNWHVVSTYGTWTAIDA